VCVSGLRAHEPAEGSVAAEFLIRVTVSEEKLEIEVRGLMDEIRPLTPSETKVKRGHFRLVSGT